MDIPSLVANHDPQGIPYEGPSSESSLRYWFNYVMVTLAV